MHFHLENEYRGLFVSDFHSWPEVAQNPGETATFQALIDALNRRPLRRYYLVIDAGIRQTESGQASSSNIITIKA
jgi:hypothetical protein